MFIWLGVALIVDTVDGPLARRVGVVKVLPRFSGERLDLIVDFLTYVAVPAFAFSQSDLLQEAFRLPAGIAVILSSLFHMAHQESKTKDGYFVGFPAIWSYPALPLRLHASARRIFLHRRVFRGADFRSNSLRASGSRG
jgi:phosphatidylcholine synthase